MCRTQYCVSSEAECTLTHDNRLKQWHSRRQRCAGIKDQACLRGGLLSSTTGTYCLFLCLNGTFLREMYWCGTPSIPAGFSWERGLERQSVIEQGGSVYLLKSSRTMNIKQYRLPGGMMKLKKSARNFKAYELCTYPKLFQHPSVSCEQARQLQWGWILEN